MAISLAVLIVTAATLVWLRFGASNSDPASIAVLPFRNLSAEKSYLADGISEEILDQLTQEPAFKVAGPASAAQFGADPDMRKIGRALGVDYILTGSVQPGSGRVRINAALIRAKDGMRLWSQTYDRKQEDMLQIQSAIGQAVADGLKRQLIHTLASRRPINGEAYALYLNARGLLRSDNPQSGQDAVLTLRQVIRIDPNFAPAWSSLANP